MSMFPVLFDHQIRAGGIINLLTNGDMELDDASWVSLSAPTTNERSAVQKYEGSYSRHIVCDAGGAGEQGCRQVPGNVLTVGKDYTMRGWIYLVSGNYVYIHATSGGAPKSTAITGSWQYVEDTFTANNAAGTVNLLAHSSAEAYFDYVWLFAV